MLYIYMLVLGGERFLNNNKQALPYERMTNFEFINKSKPNTSSSMDDARNPQGAYNCFSSNSALCIDKSVMTYATFCSRIKGLKRD